MDATAFTDFDHLRPLADRLDQVTGASQEGNVVFFPFQAESTLSVWEKEDKVY
jgi:hypothetical protein